MYSIDENLLITHLCSSPGHGASHAVWWSPKPNGWCCQTFWNTISSIWTENSLVLKITNSDPQKNDGRLCCPSDKTPLISLGVPVNHPCGSLAHVGKVRSSHLCLAMCPCTRVVEANGRPTKFGTNLGKVVLAGRHTFEQQNCYNVV